MGDIRKTKKKYSRPAHPWRMERIVEEKTICKEYGIPRRNELWKMRAKLESYKNQTKNLLALRTPQSQVERTNLFKKLETYGFIKSGEGSDAVLGITLNDVLNRRLQTLVAKKGLAKNVNQARQLITHRHILIGGKIVSSPSYLVRTAEENSIEISAASPFYDTNHAERVKESTKRKPRPAVDKKKFGRSRR